MHPRPSILVACAFALAGCGDYGAPSEVVNGVAVASLQAPDATFSQYRTFTVTPKVQVTNNTTGTPQEYTTDAPQIVAEVQAQMTQRGFTYVPWPAGALTPPASDLVVALYAYTGTQAVGGYYCDWYYWGYYPYGCGWTYYGNYTYGTLVLQLADFKNAPPPTPGAKVTGVWGAAIYGVLTTQPYNLQKILGGIDTAFAQSPYLHP